MYLSMVARLFLPVLIALLPVAEVKPVDKYPRNKGIDVLNYTFGISINDTTDVIYGRTAITLVFADTVSSFVFDLKNLRSDGKGMTVDSVIINGVGLAWKHGGDRLKINPGLKSAHGGEAVIEVVYHGIPSDGLIISNNRFKSRTFFSDHWPDRASNYLPCVDHPSDKATVDYIISAPEHYEVVAGGHLREVKHLGSSHKQWHWKEEVPVPVKVMAFGAAEFDMRFEGKPAGVPVWTYVFRENSREGFSDYSAAVKPVEFYSNLIGEYPFAKLANVQSKTIFGGLENAGCVFYSERSVTGKGRAEGLLAHEIAHQWFGDSVTEDDWHHIWLSEGFATYLTSVYNEKNYGKEKLSGDMNRARETVIKQDLKRPGSVIDTTITDLMKLLSAEAYQKGAWVLHMLRQDIGDEYFFEGLRLFYSRFRNGNVLTGDFIDVMEEVSGKELDGFFSQWLYQRSMPVLKITDKQSAGRGMREIVIAQQQVDLFSFDLDLEIESETGLTNETVKVNDRQVSIKVKSAKIKSIIPDPDVKLLFRISDSSSSAIRVPGTE